MPTIKNESEFKRQLIGSSDAPLVQALNYVLSQIVIRNESVIKTYVYDKYTPEEYQRTYEFYEAWGQELKYSATSGSAEATFYYDGKNIYTVDKDYAIHSTPVDDGPSWWYDARDYLADLIYQGSSGPLFGNGPWRKSRNAWQHLLDTLDSQRLDQWFQKGCQMAGLKVQRA